MLCPRSSTHRHSYPSHNSPTLSVSRGQMAQHLNLWSGVRRSLQTMPTFPFELHMSVGPSSEEKGLAIRREFPLFRLWSLFTQVCRQASVSRIIILRGSHPPWCQPRVTATRAATVVVTAAQLAAWLRESDPTAGLPPTQTTYDNQWR
jgi:hypothetical protein